MDNSSGKPIIINPGGPNDTDSSWELPIFTNCPCLPCMNLAIGLSSLSHCSPSPGEAGLGVESALLDLLRCHDVWPTLHAEAPRAHRIASHTQSQPRVAP